MDWSCDDLGDWKAVSRFGGLVSFSLYALFLLYAFRDSSGFLFLDFVNLIIHEAGHPLFSWFGNTLMLLGGTLLELIVPAACAVYFYFQRHTHGFVFSSFWFFENFLYIGTYMEDARANALPLVNSDIGDNSFRPVGSSGLRPQNRTLCSRHGLARHAGLRRLARLPHVPRNATPTQTPRNVTAACVKGL